MGKGEGKEKKMLGKTCRVCFFLLHSSVPSPLLIFSLTLLFLSYSIPVFLSYIFSLISPFSSILFSLFCSDLLSLAFPSCLLSMLLPSLFHLFLFFLSIYFLSIIFYIFSHLLSCSSPCFGSSPFGFLICFSLFCIVIFFPFSLVSRPFCFLLPVLISYLPLTFFPQFYPQVMCLLQVSPLLSRTVTETPFSGKEKRNAKRMWVPAVDLLITHV
ncbi:hypothetical protein FKM82_018965 [Ascaphus truei]